ncbi:MULTISPECIES: two-component system response regulator CreB [Acinetobacter]|uniref:Two-component system response regulator CreB n=1 Tax=Acinetobacter piscicola TaxID=2006115 RepID=A0A7S7AG95_9GAMM|nr:MULTISPECIES: two-component system response regulator CreB [Acinetobacter]QOW44661.1 two-component system response regulator CreB [Acinetobacter piscicola]
MNNKKQILCVEDDAAILMPLRYALEREDWQVTWANTGTQAIADVQQQNFDFIILDVGLPDLNGFDVCKKIRQFNHTPLLFLTARDDEIDRIVGLEIGADDYCTKPFSSREIVSRIKAIWRRMEIQHQLQHTPSNENVRTEITIEPLTASAKVWHCVEEALQIYYFGTMLQLTRYEYRLLKLFIDHPEQVFSRQQLMDHIWEHPEHSLERTVDTHIKSLRQKLKLITAIHDPIQTHRGFGYSLKRMQ